MLAVLRLLHDDGYRRLCLAVCPGQPHRSGINQFGSGIEGIHQVTALLGKTVHVVLDVGISVPEISPVGVCLVGIQTVLRFPVVGHSVAVAICQLRSAHERADAAQFVLVGNECTLLAQRCQLLNDALVVTVANARCPDMVNYAAIGIGCRLQVHRC